MLPDDVPAPLRGGPTGTVRFLVRVHRIEYVASGINLYELRPLEQAELPSFTAGAHIDVYLPGRLIRQYSLVNSQDERHRYVIAVKHDLSSRGGSRYMHEQLRVGASLEVSGPRNTFPLIEDAEHSVFIAGGIGITPIVAMVARLRALGRAWELHYSVRRREEAAFLDQLAGEALHLHVDAENAGRLLDLERAMAVAPGTHLYCCGPAPMLDTFERIARSYPPSQVHLERFSGAAPKSSGASFWVELHRSGRRVLVPSGKTILEALRAEGIAVEASCEQGICGTCETRVLAGTPDHRDSLLTDEERRANDRIMICCSGSLDEVLVLDL